MRYLVCLCMILLVSPRVYAETYSWVDDHGVLNFSDDLTKVPKTIRKKVKRIEDVAPSSAPEKPAAAEKKEMPDARLTGDENVGVPFYGGKPAADWRREFNVQEMELKRIEDRLQQIQLLLKNQTNTSRASYDVLVSEYNALVAEYKEKYRVYSELIESARKAGLKVDMKK